MMSIELPVLTKMRLTWKASIRKVMTRASSRGRLTPSKSASSNSRAREVDAFVRLAEINIFCERTSDDDWSIGIALRSITTTVDVEKNVKAPNLIERAKEETEAVIHTQKSPHHHKETHGTSDDIDEDTPVDEVKGPNFFERVKEEIEAVVEAIHPKKAEERGNESMTEVAEVKEEAAEAYKGVNKIGSRPPSCEHKCYGCMPCEATQVPTTAGRVGVQYANYEPEDWKCKCGPTFYSP
ncbi:hypothetical protein RJ639_009769 [Escallonia herrerae]|uniref:Epidermal patterning factor-like protein n=1 Tax=Escallonia herrerae TaxID=1293975 RepID=A0AA88VQF6_9ASTE|nr:hypothetical protein RJ639_009769 [Escallonia herrerae]